jgi:hypothetical protein
VHRRKGCYEEELTSKRNKAQRRAQLEEECYFLANMKRPCAKRKKVL